MACIAPFWPLMSTPAQIIADSTPEVQNPRVPAVARLSTCMFELTTVSAVVRPRSAT